MRGPILISDWKPREKGTLRGDFTVTLPSGWIFKYVMLHEQGNSRWIQFPSKEWTKPDGTRAFIPFVGFIDPSVREKFRNAVLAALDASLASERTYS